jgi:hypothetical protein
VKLHAGVQIGSYELLNQLSELQYIQSWQARRNDGQDYVLRIFPCPKSPSLREEKWASGFDGVPHTFSAKDDVYRFLTKNPGEYIGQLLALPSIPGIAPLLRYEILDCENDVLGVVSRRFYPERLTDRFPADADHPPSQKLLDILTLLAPALDTLEAQMPKLDFDLAPGDLLLDGEIPVIADYGLSRYNQYMDFNNRMWSSRVEHEGKRSLVGNYPGEGRFRRTEAQFALAALYVYLRSRGMIFEDPATVYPKHDDKMLRFAWVGAVFKNIKQYEETGTLPLLILPDIKERDVVAKALAINEVHRYHSCQAFVEALRML